MNKFYCTVTITGEPVDQVIIEQIQFSYSVMVTPQDEAMILLDEGMFSNDKEMLKDMFEVRIDDRALDQ